VKLESSSIRKDPLTVAIGIATTALRIRVPASLDCVAVKKVGNNHRQSTRKRRLVLGGVWLIMVHVPDLSSRRIIKVTRSTHDTMYLLA